MDHQSEWLWTEVVRASLGATTEIQFLELMIGHIRFLIKELKAVIKESCETGMLIANVYSYSSASESTLIDNADTLCVLWDLFGVRDKDVRHGR